MVNAGDFVVIHFVPPEESHSDSEKGVQQEVLVVEVYDCDKQYNTGFNPPSKIKHTYFLANPHTNFFVER